MSNNFTELVLTCHSWQEAQRIADALLEKQLVSSIETFEISPRHWWEGPQHGLQTVKLVVLARPSDSKKIQFLTGQLKNTKTSPILLTALAK